MLFMYNIYESSLSRVHVCYKWKKNKTKISSCFKFRVNIFKTMIIITKESHHL